VIRKNKGIWNEKIIWFIVAAPIPECEKTIKTIAIPFAVSR
jgi:hypothetical protein